MLPSKCFDGLRKQKPKTAAKEIPSILEVVESSPSHDTVRDEDISRSSAFNENP
jgi:hypothetical protein